MRCRCSGRTSSDILLSSKVEAQPGSFTSFLPSRQVRFAPRADIRPMPAFMSARPTARPGAALSGTARSRRATLPFTHLAREGRMTVTIGRRELLVALGGAVVWPLATRAQQGERVRRSTSLFKVKAVASDGVRLMRRRRRRTCLLGINCGEQLLHGARRRFAERLVEANRLRKLLADKVIAPGKFGVVRERLLNAMGVAAAQRPRRMPRQQGLDLVSLFLIHGQPRSIPFALRSEEGTWIARQCLGMARLDASEQQDAARSGRDQARRSRALPRTRPRQSKNVWK